MCKDKDLRVKEVVHYLRRFQGAPICHNNTLTGLPWKQVTTVQPPVPAKKPPQWSDGPELTFMPNKSRLLLTNLQWSRLITTRTTVTYVHTVL